MAAADAGFAASFAFLSAAFAMPRERKSAAAAIRMQGVQDFVECFTQPPMFLMVGRPMFGAGDTTALGAARQEDSG